MTGNGSAVMHVRCLCYKNSYIHKYIYIYVCVGLCLIEREVMLEMYTRLRREKGDMYACMYVVHVCMLWTTMNLKKQN